MTTTPGSAGAAAAPRLGMILLACCVGQFMVVLDASIVNVALDPIQKSLDLSPDSLQWVINAYTIVFAGFLLLGGRLADLFGRRKVYAAGLILFTVTSLIAGVAGNGEWLLVARGLQGLGGAILAPATLTIIFTSFSDWTAKAKALGTWGAVAAAGGAVGALLGGVLTHWVSWRWVFLVNVPIGIALLVLIFAVVPESRNEDADRRIDTSGAVAITGGLMAIVFGVVESNSKGWSSPETVVALIVGAALVLYFVLNEWKIAKNPLVPLSIFSNRSVTSASIVSFTTSASLVAVLFLLTLQMQFVYGWSSLQTGLAYVPMSVTILVLARGVAPRLTQAIGAGRVLVLGGVLAAIGTGWLAFGPHSGDFVKDLLVPTMLYGAGSGLTTATVTVAGTTNVPFTQAGLVSGLLNASRQVGGALWLGVLAAVLATYPASLLPNAASFDGYHRAYLVGALLPLIGAFAGVFVPKKQDAPAGSWGGSSSQTGSTSTGATAGANSPASRSTADATT